MKSIRGFHALIAIIIFISGCNDEKSGIPVVVTVNTTNITSSSATSGGEVTADGGNDITARGICWNTSGVPTIADNLTSESGTVGSFTSELTDLQPDTRYYVRAYAANGAGTGYGNQVVFTTTRSAVPVLTTAEITLVAQKSAVSGGNISADNGSQVLSRGICWSTSPGPTITDSKITTGTGVGEYSGIMTGLLPNTIYYVRAWATNRSGTAYGNEQEFTTLDFGSATDADGNSYRTIIIGTQEWMIENLRTTRYSNGESLPLVPLDEDWGQQVEGAYCWYDNTELPNKTLYGALYNWYTVSDSRNVCPEGWRVPDDADWTVLTDYLTSSGYGYGGSGENIAKSMAANSGWIPSENEGTIGNDQATNNSSGLESVPGGVRTRSGSFAVIEFTASMWSASEKSFTYANAITLSSEYTKVFRGYTYKQDAASIRCLKNISR